MLCFVYAYNMRTAEDQEIWPLLIAHRVISYHDDFTEASHEVTRLINEDMTDPDECFASHSIPLCHNEHNLV